MLTLSFWFVFCAKFPGCIDSNEPEVFLSNMRKKLSKKYVKIISEMPQDQNESKNNEELINYMVFTLGYSVHYLFYKYFQKQKFYFDLRFILDCYHILIFEINGIYVSDFYIRHNIDRIFNNRFLHYQNKNTPKNNKNVKIQKKQLLHSVDIKDFFEHNPSSKLNDDFSKEMTKKFIQKQKK